MALGARSVWTGIWGMQGALLSGVQSVASEGSLRAAGAQEAKCTRQYMSIPSTAGAPDAERSSFAAAQSDRISVNAVDHAGAAHAPDQVGEVLAVPHFQREQDGRRERAAIGVFHVLDVGTRCRDRGG